MNAQFICTDETYIRERCGRPAKWWYRWQGGAVAPRCGMHCRSIHDQRNRYPITDVACVAKYLDQTKVST